MQRARIWWLGVDGISVRTRQNGWLCHLDRSYSHIPPVLEPFSFSEMSQNLPKSVLLVMILAPKTRTSHHVDPSLREKAGDVTKLPPGVEAATSSKLAICQSSTGTGIRPRKVFI